MEVTKSPVEYLPNIYAPKHPSIHKLAKPTSDTIDIGCFGAIRPLKNQLQQATSAIIFANRIGKTLRFHINASRTEQSGDQVLRNLRSLFEGQRNHKLKHELVEHPWMPHAEFVKICNFMDLGMQVSFSESFNIVTADLVTHHVPMVVSTDVDWMPAASKAVPTDTEEIVNKLYSAWKYPRWAIRRNSAALSKYNKKALKVWLDYLKNI
jgi:hypothetical protein